MKGDADKAKHQNLILQRFEPVGAKIYQMRCFTNLRVSYFLLVPFLFQQSIGTSIVNKM
jgi:hypothetical protein